MRDRYLPKLTFSLSLFGSLFLWSFGAADEPLRAELALLGDGWRSTAPSELVVKLTSDGSRLLSGHLECLFQDGEVLVGRVRTPLLSLKGEQSFGVFVPPFDQSFYRNPTVQLKFTAETEEMDLGTHPLPGTSLEFQGRMFAILASGDSPTRALLCNRLKLEALHSRFASLPNNLKTVVKRVEPPQLPTEPLRYCAYDIVVLSGSAFVALTEKQLLALERWVAAGGSLCAVLGKPLAPYHLDFLNRFSGNQEGSGISQLFAGLGRLVILDTSPSSRSDLDGPEWRKACAFLWRVRAKHTRRILKQSQLPPEVLRFETLPVDSGDQLLKSLLPENLRILPFRLLLWILFLFFLAVGPGVYLFFRTTQRHRWSWAVVLTASVGFTFLTIFLSHLYMGGISSRRSIVFCDLGSQGHILRRSAYTLSFSSTEQELMTDVTGSFFASVPRSEYDPHWTTRYRYNKDAKGQRIPHYVGQVPRRFRVLQTLPQWDPRLTRLFSIETSTPPRVPNLNWDAVDADTLRDAAKLKHVKKLLFGEEFRGNIYLWNRFKHTRIFSSGTVDPRRFLHAVSVRPLRGLFSLVSQISPDGGPSFDDLALLDATDSHQWLLVVTVRQGGDLFVFRRLYRGGPH